MQLEAWELQELVFLTGSKKAFAQYLGLDGKQAEEVWKENKLQTPVEYLRGKPSIWILFRLAGHGSIKVMAAYFGLSAAALRGIVDVARACTHSRIAALPSVVTREVLERVLGRCKSIRLAYRILKEGTYEVKSESALRKQAEEWGLDLADLLDWSFSNHANAKGRRAELEFARLRGANILEDYNKTMGSQADTDFLDQEYGRVNVKSSRTYKMKAKTRRGDPYYGKFSLSAIEKSGSVAFMLYDRMGRVFVGWKVVRVNQLPQNSKTMVMSVKEFK